MGELGAEQKLVRIMKHLLAVEDLYDSMNGVGTDAALLGIADEKARVVDWGQRNDVFSGPTAAEHIKRKARNSPGLLFVRSLGPERDDLNEELKKLVDEMRHRLDKVEETGQHPPGGWRHGDTAVHTERAAHHADKSIGVPSGDVSVSQYHVAADATNHLVMALSNMGDDDG